jgi:hypothetical protein
MYCDVYAVKILRSRALLLYTFTRVRRGFSVQRGSDRVRHGSVRVRRGSESAAWLTGYGVRKNDGINALIHHHKNSGHKWTGQVAGYLHQPKNPYKKY